MVGMLPSLLGDTLHITVSLADKPEATIVSPNTDLVPGVRLNRGLVFWEHHLGEGVHEEEETMKYT